MKHLMRGLICTFLSTFLTSIVSATENPSTSKSGNASANNGITIEWCEKNRSEATAFAECSMKALYTKRSAVPGPQDGEVVEMCKQALSTFTEVDVIKCHTASMLVAGFDVNVQGALSKTNDCEIYANNVATFVKSYFSSDIAAESVSDEHCDRYEEILKRRNVRPESGTCETSKSRILRIAFCGGGDNRRSKEFKDYWLQHAVNCETRGATIDMKLEKRLSSRGYEDSRDVNCKDVFAIVARFKMRSSDEIAQAESAAIVAARPDFLKIQGEKACAVSRPSSKPFPNEAAYAYSELWAKGLCGGASLLDANLLRQIHNATGMAKLEASAQACNISIQSTGMTLSFSVRVNMSCETATGGHTKCSGVGTPRAEMISSDPIAQRMWGQVLSPYINTAALSDTSRIEVELNYDQQQCRWLAKNLTFRDKTISN